MKHRTKELANYEIFVEGGHVSTVKNITKAFQLRRKYENEGWNVRILKVVPTIMGIFKTEV